MPGPAPKPAAIRARRNKTSTETELQVEDERPLADLPARLDGQPWHVRVVAWWDELRSSAVAGELLNVDGEQLLVGAQLLHLFWIGDTKVAGEYRLWLKEYGLTVAARRSLGWKKAGATPRGRATPPQGPAPRTRDTRTVLQALDGGKARSAKAS